MKQSNLLIHSKASKSRKKDKPIHILGRTKPKILQNLIQIIIVTAIKVLRF